MTIPGLRRRNAAARTPAARLRGQSGVTLTELMIATAILTIGLLALFAAFQFIGKAITRSRMDTIANNLAQEEVEVLKNVSYYQLNVTTSMFTDANYTPNLVYDQVNYPPETITQWNQTLTRSVRVDYATVVGTSVSTVSYTNPDTSMKMVTVYVSWKTPDGTYKVVKLENLYELATAQTLNGTINGTVTTAPGGSPAIASARVTVIGYPNWYGYADTGGNYSFQVAQGTYSLIASSAGYYSAVSPSMNIAQSGSNSYSFQLSQIATGTIGSSSLYIPDQYPVISQVVVSTVQANTSYYVEYVELFNGTSSQINMSSCNPSGSPPSCTGGTLINLNFQSTCGNIRTCNNIAMVYVSTYIPIGGYYLISNTTTFVVNGQTLAADAYYDKNNGCSPDADWTPANQNCTLCKVLQTGHNGTLWLTNGGGTTLDEVGWYHNGNRPSPGCNGGCICWNSPTCAALGLGFLDGDQIVRYSSAASMGNTWVGSSGAMYGRAYNDNDNVDNFYYNNTGVAAGIPYQTFTRASSIQSIIAGWPSTGSYISANDGYSSSTTSFSNTLTGAQGQVCPISSFTLVGVATGTWKLDVDGVNTLNSVNFSTTIANITVTQNVTTKIPSAATNPTWSVSGFNYSVLASTYTGGFIQGHVYGSGSLYSTPLNSILMANDQNTRTTRTASDGSYNLLVPTGTVTVYADFNNDNASYIPSNTAVTLTAGQIQSQDFHLVAGAFISGYVTGGSGLGALPNIVVQASLGSTTAQSTTDSTGHFYIQVTTSASAYTVAPQLDASESYTTAPTSPMTATVTNAGSTVFAGTITVSGEMVNITGNVTYNSNAITTGVLILASTNTISNPPPVIYGSSAPAQTPVYAVSSQPDGTYTLPVRLSTTNTYYIMGFYPNVDPNTGNVAYTAKSLSGVNVNTVSGVSGENLAWP